MKLRMSQLRKMVRDALNEEAALPGKWFPYDGESVDPDEIELMGTGGLGRRSKKVQSEQVLREADLAGEKLKLSSMEEFKKKFPDFHRIISVKYRSVVKDSIFVVNGGGFFSKGTPMFLPPDQDMLVYWEDGREKYATGTALIDKVYRLGKNG